jgi:hypothetical protein
MRSTARITDAVRRSRKALLVAGSAAAILGVGAGTASAATAAPPVTAVARHHHGAGRVEIEHAVVSRASRLRELSWTDVEAIQARRANPVLGRGPLPAADQLQPVAAYGAQQYMPLDTAQVGNATTIVRQALDMKMGVRSAVVAVATAMQESELNNINYGTSDSIGLFQQRPSCGWGTEAQIMNPAYASDAFLVALQKYQAANPEWASQPLYQAAQGVQASAFPTAYAQWEDQAASLVQGITMHLTQLGV